jgi:YebC/PmpR family DNA-binding regulatory protein
MIDCLTDNRNRAAMMLRSSLTKHGGNLGTDGSVSYLFKRLGIIEVENKYDFDQIMEIAISSDAIDVIDNEHVYTIFTDPSNFIQVKEALEQNGINEFLTSEITYYAENKIKLDDEKSEKVMNLIDALNDIDDVQDVYHNLEV